MIHQGHNYKGIFLNNSTLSFVEITLSDIDKELGNLDSLKNFSRIRYTNHDS